MRNLTIMIVEDTMNLTIGKIIKDLRTKRGMSQEKLAEHLNMAPQSVSKWERGISHS